MDDFKKLSALIQLAETLDIPIRRAPAAIDGQSNPGGSLVKFKGKEIIFLDTGASVSDQISVVALALVGRIELEEMFIKPEIRNILDEAAGDR